MNDRNGTDSTLCLEARHIKKIFDNGATIEVLRDVNLRLFRGETVAVVGSSGTGKTTLLHILGALDQPTAGTVHYFGQDIHAGVDLDTLRNRTIGFVFQFHYLLPEFTALENVIMPGLIARQPKKELVARGVRLLDEVGLADRRDHLSGELSGGEQQRVAIARALIMEPAVLLADEPTGNLDPRTGQKVFDCLRRLTQTHRLAIVVVTHDMELAGSMDRCLRLADGVLREESPGNP